MTHNEFVLEEIARLECKIRELRKEIDRPLPDKWEIGMKVRFIKSTEWGHVKEM